MSATTCHNCKVAEALPESALCLFCLKREALDLERAAAVRFLLVRARQEEQRFPRNACEARELARSASLLRSAAGELEQGEHRRTTEGT